MGFVPGAPVMLISQQRIRVVDKLTTRMQVSEEETIFRRNLLVLSYIRSSWLNTLVMRACTEHGMSLFP